jgi:hypothetical protein
VHFSVFYEDFQARRFLSSLLNSLCLYTNFDYRVIELGCSSHALGIILPNNRAIIHPQNVIDRFGTKSMDSSHPQDR